MSTPLSSLNFGNFVTNYSINPSSKTISSKDQKIAWVTTIILGILTLGLLQLNAWIIKKISDSNTSKDAVNKHLKVSILAMSTSPLQHLSSPAVQAPATSSSLKWKQYQQLLDENTLKEPREFIVPKRRVCNFGEQISTRKIEDVEECIFINEEEILEIHPMRFLRDSPFVRPPADYLVEHYLNAGDDYFVVESSRQVPSGPETVTDRETLAKQLEAVAITESGKHVILQQTYRSCVPTCVGMLALDHGKAINYRAIERTYLANSKMAMGWIEEAGLTSKKTIFSDETNLKEALITSLKENGSGILSIYHPEAGPHVIILDEISSESNSAIIRDPLHGWSLTIKLDSLLTWVKKYGQLSSGAYFIQIAK